MTECVVIVEDEAEVRNMLREVLEEEGFTVIALAHPELVSSLDESVRPCVFLLDLMLPGTSGIELAQRLRSSGFSDTPIIAMSASDLMLRLAVESRVFQACMPKPFEIPFLMDQLSRFAS